MFKDLFRADSWLWKPFGWLADIVVLSLLWVVFCLPVVTIGGATAALYDAVVHDFRRKESDYMYRFFETFKAEWKRGILPTLVCGLAVGGVYAGYRLLVAFGTGNGAVMLAMGLLVLLCIPVGVTCWVFPILSRFEQSGGTLLSNAVRLALAHLPSTCAMALVTGFCFWLSVQFWAIPLIILPALLVLFWSLFIERVFKAYGGDQ